MEIPVIDFAECGLLKEGDNNVKEENLFKAGLELYSAFAEVGFAYIINSGMPSGMVAKMNEFAETFFSQSLEEKLKFCNKKVAGICYDAEGVLKIFKDRPSEKVEGLRMATRSGDIWPDIPGLKKNSIYFSDLCKILVQRILKALGRGMKLKNVDLFHKAHELMNMEGNPSQLKINYYPAIFREIEKDSFRLAEHSDFGTITLLFHEKEDIRGLQVERTNGEYVDIKRVPNSILLTVGDELKFWTGGRLRSVKHRVIVPDDIQLRSNARKSIAYFGMADDEASLAEVQFEDSEEKHNSPKTSMTGKEYLDKRFKDVFINY